MSKQSEAKEKQGYTPKAIPQVCGNCAHFQSEMKHPTWMKPGIHDHYLQDPSCAVESDLRCGIGSFAIKKMGTYNEWVGKLN